jgi:hypothetical protein
MPYRSCRRKWVPQRPGGKQLLDHRHLTASRSWLISSAVIQYSAPYLAIKSASNGLFFVIQVGKLGSHKYRDIGVNVGREAYLKSNKSQPVI